VRLYELTGAYLQVFEQLDDEEANLDTLEDTLQCIEGEIEVKAESIGKLIKMLEFDADRIDDEMKRLQKMKDDLKKKRDARENRISRVKAYLRDQMDIIGKQKIKTPLMTNSISAKYLGMESLLIWRCTSKT
jgi:DNA repair ATPase RecN